MRLPALKLIVSLALFCASGCSNGPPAPGRVIIALDRSESTAPMRGAQLVAIKSAQRTILGMNMPLEAWCFDTTPVRVYGPEVPEEKTVIKKIKQEEMVPDPQHLHIRTRPAALLEALNAEAPDWKGGQVTVIVMTDGDNDFANDNERVKDAAAKLAALPNVRIALIGVHTGNRDFWQKFVGSAFGNRYSVADASDQKGAILQCLK